MSTVELLAETGRQYGPWVMFPVAAALGVIAVAAHRLAAPGTQVKFLWGAASYTKKPSSRADRTVVTCLTVVIVATTVAIAASSPRVPPPSPQLLQAAPAPATKERNLQIEWPREVVSNVARLGGKLHGISQEKYRIHLYMLANDGATNMFWLNRPDGEADVAEAHWAVDARFGDEFPDETHTRKEGLQFSVIAIAVARQVSPPLDPGKPDFVTATSFDDLEKRVREKDPEAVFSNIFNVARVYRDAGPAITALSDGAGIVMPRAGSMLVSAAPPLTIAFSEPTIMVERYVPGYSVEPMGQRGSKIDVPFSPTDAVFELKFRRKPGAPSTSLWVKARSHDR